MEPVQDERKLTFVAFSKDERRSESQGSFEELRRERGRWGGDEREGEPVWERDGLKVSKGRLMTARG